jgi:superfamily I DNA/RNA helicase
MTHNSVAIMSIHASKGLEFDRVFAAGLEEGFLPFSLYETEHIPPERLDEEKRLLYAAMTRARRGLYLSCVRKRLFTGQNTQRGQEPLF